MPMTTQEKLAIRHCLADLLENMDLTIKEDLYARGKLEMANLENIEQYKTSYEKRRYLLETLMQGDDVFVEFLRALERHRQKSLADKIKAAVAVATAAEAKAQISKKPEPELLKECELPITVEIRL